MSVKHLTKLSWLAWFLLIILLPLTSLPLMAIFTGGSMVAPPSLVFAGLLFLLMVLPAWIRGREVPRQAMPLFVFILVAAIASLLAYFIDIPPFKNVSFLGNMVEALFTLGVGVCFYLVTAHLAEDIAWLNAALRWINWSGLAIILWSMAQLVFSETWLEPYPDWMYTVQTFFSSSRTILFPGRVTGFAFEPSWLAHQLNLLYLPLWLAATVRRTSAHGWRIWFLSFENVLLVGGMATLWFSLSRVGLAAFLLMLGYLFFLGNAALVRRFQTKFFTRVRLRIRPLMTVGISLALLVFYLLLILAAAYGLTQVDYRMAALFDFSTLQSKGLIEYANTMFFAERITFWQTGWEVFNDHPVLGVGLGNTGYFFPQELSDFGWQSKEISKLIHRNPALPNAKSLWVRLLAETGIVGLAVFLAWCVLLWVGAGRLWKAEKPIYRTVALAARFVLIGLVIEGFSLDTFALPYFWVSFGLLTAALNNSQPSEL